MIEETQGNESSTENVSSTGSEAGAAPAASEKMPDDPSFAENADGLTAADPSQKKPDPAKPAYTPNFKFKVLDKEQEFDEWLKAAVKDADTEKKARDLYERAHGLEHVKSDRQRIREMSQQQAQQIADHQNVVQNVNTWRDKKDFDSLLGYLGVQEHDLFAYVHKKLERKALLEQMPSHQREAIESAEQDRRRLHDVESQNQQLQQSYQQVAVTARTQELDWTLGRPEYSQVAEAYDQRAGRPGAFKQAIIERGQYHAYSSGRDLSPEEAIKEVLSFLGGAQALVPPQNVQVPGGFNPAGPQGQQVAPQKPPVLTNIQGRGTSPAKKMVRSLDDLKKRAKELEATNG